METISRYYSDYLDMLIGGDKAGCLAIVQDLIDKKTPVKDMYTELFQRSMYEIGELWEQSRISVAVEHIATAITEGLINLLYPTIFSVERAGRTAIVSCIANEYHQIGARMVADIFELNGWDGHFVGANAPIEGLLVLIQEKKPDILALSLSLYSNFLSFIETLKNVRSSFPDTEIIVGGQAFRWGGVEALGAYPHTTYVPDLASLETLIRAV